MTKKTQEAISYKFMDKVRVGGNSDCWEWTGPKKKAGYGVYRVGSKQHRAHRLMYEAAHKTGLKPGDLVCHTCDNPGCVNPAHLFLGSHDDNMADMVSKGRSPHGSRNSHATLTKQQVIEIRKRHAAGEAFASITEDMPVSCDAVRKAALGISWSRVKG